MCIILIDEGGQCTCNCASKCIVGKTGSAMRCTRQEIEGKGYSPKTLKEIIKTPYYELGISERKSKKLNKTYRRYK